MKNWTIKKRIILGFTAILVLVGIMTVASFTMLRKVKAEADFVDKDSIPCLTLVSEIEGQVGEIQVKVLRLLLSKNPEERKKIEGEIAGKRTETQKLMDDYKKLLSDPEDKKIFAQLEQDRDAYVAGRTRLFELTHADKMDEAIAFNNSTLTPLYYAYQATIDKLFEFNIKDTDSSSERSVTAVGHANLISGILSISVIVLGMLFAAVIVVSLNKVLSRVATSLGDGSNQVVAAASQVSSSSQSLAEGASEQAASLEETSASLEEMSSMTKRNSENAQKANDLAKQARAAADKGSADMQTMSSAMEAIKVSSDDIAKIIKTIDEIAFQTNILALNAAVEAARAGEAGMGFAVVADEVRNLAQRSAQAAKETAGKIEGAITKTGQGVEISAKVVEGLSEIVAKIRQVDELIAEVASASREQTTGITQVNTAVGQMDKVTQSNAASAEESAAAAEELNAQALAMTESVNELMQLVGGQTQNRPVRTATTAGPARTAPRPAAKQSTNGRTNGNGHSHTAPAIKTTDKGRIQIPMDGDFKDF